LPGPDGAVREIAARIRDPVDPVASGLAAAQDEDVADGGRAVSHELGLFREPDAGDVHHDVAEISFLEDNATRDGRNPDPVAVITNPGDDPPEEILRVSRSLRELVQRIIQWPEVLLDAAHFIDAEREPHPLAELRELRRRGVAQDHIVQGEWGGPSYQPLVHPCASGKDKRRRYIMLLVRSGTPRGMEASSSS